MDLEIIVFRTVKIGTSDEWNTYEIDWEDPRERLASDEGWRSTNCEQLTRYLRQTVHSERERYEVLLKEAGYDRDIKRLRRQMVKPNAYELIENATNPIHRFILRAPLNIIYREDRHAFSQERCKEPFYTTHYAVVLLWEGVYYGHIYTWLGADSAESTIYAQGIRASLDDQLVRKLPSVATLLLEGVRLFGIERGRKTIYIISPMDAMITILDRLDFDRITYYPSDEDIGSCYAGSNDILPKGNNRVASTRSPFDVRVTSISVVHCDEAF